ncbi:hypothetical protein HYQ44_001156 [Verticillium longisporum]|nr:hypothetical protein HYQ44_001156 [Verticillium longisporum]
MVRTWTSIAQGKQSHVALQNNYAGQTATLVQLTNHLPVLFSFDNWSSTWYRYCTVHQPLRLCLAKPRCCSIARPSQAAPLTPSIKAQDLSYI